MAKRSKSAVEIENDQTSSTEEFPKKAWRHYANLYWYAGILLTLLVSSYLRAIIPLKNVFIDGTVRFASDGDAWHHIMLATSTVFNLKHLWFDPMTNFPKVSSFPTVLLTPEAYHNILDSRPGPPKHPDHRHRWSFLPWNLLGWHSLFFLIQIMSIHQAKGLEFPVVVMGSVVNERLPISQRAETFESPYHLRASGYPEVEDPHLVDERKLFYVAASRARDLLIIGTSDAKTEFVEGPSIFLKEMFGENQIEDATKAYIENAESRPHPNAVMPRHSFSQLSYFLECPIRYKYAEHTISTSLAGSDGFWRQCPPSNGSYT